jgi:sarcosine oxidase subunit alpha
MSPRPITFFFENRRVTAQEGDSIAKALFDANVRTLSYSVKYKRPRGLHCARGRCVMCHMEVDGVTGVPTCITAAREGMRVQRENFQPFFAPLLTAAARLIPFPAGFYYRMFTRPAGLRRMFMATLRRMAGVGRVRTNVLPAGSQTSSPTKGNDIKGTYDVIVVGGGMSGMSAASAAAQGGAAVLLVDEYPALGGHAAGFHADDELATARDQLRMAVGSNSGIDVLHRTTAQGFFPPDTLLLGPGGAVAAEPDNSRRALQRVTAGKFIFATGGYDIVPLFDNNDTPGIFGARSLRLLLERDNLRPGMNAVVYGHGPELVEALQLIRQHGIDIAAVVDPGSTESAALADVRCARHSRIESVSGTEWVNSVEIDGSAGKNRIACDVLCTAFNGQGAYELAFQAGFRFEMSQDELQENKVMLPTELNRHDDNGITFHVVGELAGQRSWRDKIAAGEAAAAAAADSQRAS